MSGICSCLAKPPPILYVCFFHFPVRVAFHVGDEMEIVMGIG